MECVFTWADEFGPHVERLENERQLLAFLAGYTGSAAKRGEGYALLFIRHPGAGFEVRA